MSLQPQWRKVAKAAARSPLHPDNAQAKIVRCENGDPFPLLVDSIVDLIANEGQNFVNSFLVEPANDVLESIQIPGLGDVKDFVSGATGFAVENVFNPLQGILGRRLQFSPGVQRSNVQTRAVTIGQARATGAPRTVHRDSLLGRPIPRVCFPSKFNPGKCDAGYISAADAATLARCENSQFGLEEMCFFARVKCSLLKPCLPALLIDPWRFTGQRNLYTRRQTERLRRNICTRIQDSGPGRSRVYTSVRRVFPLH